MGNPSVHHIGDVVSIDQQGWPCVGYRLHTESDLVHCQTGANDRSISDIEEQLKALQSECFTMEQLIADARRSIVNLAKTWLASNLARRQEVQTALFPDGLVFSPDFLFLNRVTTH